MNTEQHIQNFAALGNYISKAILDFDSDAELQTICRKAESQNPWFTHNNIIHAFEGVLQMLQYDNLKQWLSSYTIEPKRPKVIAVIMAGNIPLVGFHDALCVLITGNHLLAKVSSKDAVLLEYTLRKLIEIAPKYSQAITISNTPISNFDAIISTGSENSSRYFEYYFNKYPHIIRKHRNSVAILLGNETPDTLQALSNDIFQYFGLGCRNVSKIYIPEDFDITKLIDAFESFGTFTLHNKYMNNYEYNKSIYLVSQIPHYDNGFILCKEDEKISSPLAVVFYEKYSNFADVQTIIKKYAENIQCIVCNDDLFYKKNILPGKTQTPEVWDYADDIDTISFILNV